MGKHIVKAGAGRSLKILILLVCMIVTLVPALAQPVPISGFADQGTFHLYVQEARLGHLKSTWKADGSFQASMTISMAGQTVQHSYSITTDAAGLFQEIVQDIPSIGKMTTVRDGANITFTVKEKTFTATLKPDTLLFIGNAPPLASVAIRRYDQAKGGLQTFPMLSAPGTKVDARLERRDHVQRTVGGKEMTFTRYSLGFTGLEATLWTGPDHKIYLTEFPSQHATFVREGYEALRAEPAAEANISAPTFEVSVERNVSVPMRDGTKLAADLYRPVSKTKVPVIVVRTPYKKEMSELDGQYYAKRGYAFLIQDVRGRFASPGEWRPFFHEADDGYDTIEWAAQQSWCTGKAGMIGASYLGWVQWWAASRRPPHLATIIPNVAPPDPFYNIPYEYGAFFLTGAIWWADVLQTGATGDLSGAAMGRIADKKYTKILAALPVIELDKAVLGKENPYWREWIRHPNNDDFWAPANFLDRLKDVNIPVFHQSGWFDGDGIGSKLNYARMSAHNAANQKLVLGPWGHSPQAARVAFGRDFGADALLDLNREYVRWFDRWLKGIENRIEKEPLVSVFAMGSNKWLHGNSYPLPQTKFEPWYLDAAGKLTREAPGAQSVPDRYTYDPGDPTPSPDYYEDANDSKSPRDAEAAKKKADGYHDELLKTRKDILTYTTEPFTKPYTFVGPVSMVLFASSSAVDTDWFATLYEYNEKGKYLRLGQGKIRARFRQSTSKPQPLKPGEIYEYTLDLWQTGITIPAGSRLRIEVASASFPLFSRNLNTGGHNEMETKYVAAEQTIFHDLSHPSRVILPMIEKVD
jgi:putative CocE/NonD family hydrolase